MIFLVPLLTTMAAQNDKGASMYYGNPHPSYQVSRPSIYSTPSSLNQTSVVPIAGWSLNDYFTDAGSVLLDSSHSASYQASAEVLTMFWALCSVTINSLRAAIIFRPTLFGVVLLTLLSVLCMGFLGMYQNKRNAVQYEMGTNDDEALGEVS